MGLLKSTIKRSEWNGNTLLPVYASQLLTREGLRCCLGFAGRDAGVADDDLCGVCYIHGLHIHGLHNEELPKSLELLVERDGAGFVTGESDVSHNLTTANDNGQIFATMAEKEAYIIAEGLKAGIEFTFVD